MVASTEAVDEVALRSALLRMFVEELNAVDARGSADWPRRRTAAANICQMAGITDMIRAISMAGELRPPPQWPEVDCVPVGGGPGFITCEVRTFVAGRGRLVTRMGLTKTATGFDGAQIEEAVKRGKYELRKMIG